MTWDWEKLKEKQKNHNKSDVPPNIDEFFNRFKNLNLPGGIFIFFVIILLVIAYTSVFTIETGHVGVVQRFGKYVREVQDGLHFKWPSPIESVSKVSMNKVETETFDAGFEDSSGRFNFSVERNAINPSLMLTADLNVAVVPWDVQYRVKNAYDYLFNVEDVTGLLRDMSEASMRQIIGDRSVTEVIKRTGIEAEVQDILQKELDEAFTGIKIISIKMKVTNVPASVQPSWNEVNQATQEKEKLIYEAREEYNRIIYSARGEADKMIREAEGYAIERINQAKGDSARFKALYLEYSKAKDVTKRRLYLETMKKMLPKIGNKYIIDSNQTNLLPLLNLGKESELTQ